MDPKEKKALSESDIKAKFIIPAIVQGGWDEMTQVRCEVTLTPGPVIVQGNLSSRNKKKEICRLRFAEREGRAGNGD